MVLNNNHILSLIIEEETTVGVPVMATPDKPPYTREELKNDPYLHGRIKNAEFHIQKLLREIDEFKLTRGEITEPIDIKIYNTDLQIKEQEILIAKLELQRLQYEQQKRIAEIGEM